MKKHPMQPIVTDEHGVERFRANKIVEHLLEHGGIDLNALACLEFSREDREQFAQLIGYSVGGYSELGYVSDESAATAEKMASNPETSELEARNEFLRGRLGRLADAIKAAVAELFSVHPDDLEGR